MASGELDRHPAEELLRAYADGELRSPRAWRVVVHLRRCPACRLRVAEEREFDGRTSQLLASLNPAVDVREGWLRLRAVHSRPRVRPGRARLVAAVSIGGVFLVLGALAILRVRVAPRSASAAELQDRCCWDLDGGGPGDDGIVTVILPGERVLAVALYEDENASGGLTARDPVRFGTREGVATGGDGPAKGFREGTHAERLTIMRDFCCADYDGGGPSDDGVYTINRPGQQVLRVVLYEDRDGNRRYTPADLVRWSGGPGGEPGVPIPAFAPELFH